jgi:hypothetical protein
MLRALPQTFTIKTSDSDGLGLFASEDIIIFPTAISHIHHPFIGWLRTSIGAFINHSDTPNCVVQEHSTVVNSKKAIENYNLDRYLLGSRYNTLEGVEIKVRYLLQNAPIYEGDELTIKYEDILYHGIGPVDYPRFSKTEEEEGQTRKDIELVGAI